MPYMIHVVDMDIVELVDLLLKSSAFMCIARHYRGEAQLLEGRAGNA